ncbi:inositol monophosphatase family protein [Aquipuribacter hungaricus]|uniref:Inositol-1-monophosphatase n=1 Tax=Aquipuribacter hungaricus TaxID=545624 RepID=A0ABV7WEU4_9MICO
MDTTHGTHSSRVTDGTRGTDSSHVTDGHPLPPGTDPEQLRLLAVRLAAEAGRLLLEHRRGVVSVARTKSTATDVVTAADLAAERRVRELLAAERPDDGVLGEEEAALTGTSGLTWVVDPLDGTVNYLYGTGSYAVSVAVVAGPPRPDAWRAVAGAVLDVERGQTFSATAGGGARLDGPLPGGEHADGLPLEASGCTSLAACLLGTGFGYDAGVRAEQGRAVAELLPRVRDVRRVGAAALDLCMVAAGRLDAYVERGLHPWDHAAGVLVAREAGAVVTGPDGGPVDARLCVAAAPGVAAELDRAVRESGYSPHHLP